MTDGTGAVTGSIAYEAFGQPVATSGSSASPYTFAATSGYRSDGDAGLTHVGARYYDAQAGRFITRDTLLDQHPYLYCGHDPVNAVDPSGHGLTSLDGNPENAKLAAECIEDIDNVNFSDTVVKEIPERPYINSPNLMREIGNAVQPVPDPQGVPGGVKWIVDGSWNGSNGVYELVINVVTKTVIHFLYRSH